MEWQPLIKDSNAHLPFEVGEYREYQTDEYYIMEFRSPDRQVSFLSDTFKWAKSRFEGKQYVCEYGEVGSGGLIVKIPIEMMRLTTPSERIRREIMSCVGWVYSKHDLRSEIIESDNEKHAEATDKEYETKW